MFADKIWLMSLLVRTKDAIQRNVLRHFADLNLQERALTSHLDRWLGLWADLDMAVATGRASVLIHG
jgi:hypothetical protein